MKKLGFLRFLKKSNREVGLQDRVLLLCCWTPLSLSVAFTISQMVLVLDDKFKVQEQEFNMQQLDYEN